MLIRFTSSFLCRPERIQQSDDDSLTSATDVLFGFVCLVSPRGFLAAQLGRKRSTASRSSLSTLLLSFSVRGAPEASPDSLIPFPSATASWDPTRLRQIRSDCKVAVTMDAAASLDLDFDTLTFDAPDYCERGVISSPPREVPRSSRGSSGLGSRRSSSGQLAKECADNPFFPPSVALGDLNTSDDFESDAGSAARHRHRRRRRGKVQAKRNRVKLF